MTKSIEQLRVVIICGGPSLERGISLNSARSVMDHLQDQAIALEALYVDSYQHYYAISLSQLYSNTPADFDFKLAQTAHHLEEKELLAKLKKADLVFPIIHGAYGEDGQLQAFLEAHQIPFVGPSSMTCQKMFFKNKAAALLASHGFHTIQSQVLEKQNAAQNCDIIRHFFATHHLTRAVIKPAAGGSSIGVFGVTSPENAIEKMDYLFNAGYGNSLLIEEFCQGKEFTIIILENHQGKPVALIPSEIQVHDTEDPLFTYRRKYLPSANTAWPCPPTFSDDTIVEIQKQAENLFTLFGMRDFARIDGWLLNGKTIAFTDFNPISGMEQNSFIFQQAARLGMRHQDLLNHILQRACQRYEIVWQPAAKVETQKKLPVNVIFGGNSAERQVSLMSGTNVWLKLGHSEHYAPRAFLLDIHNDVWSLPYAYGLSHTVEEIYANCVDAPHNVKRIDTLSKSIIERLPSIPKGYRASDLLPQRMTLPQFLSMSQADQAFVFLGLHGGDGENGTFQQLLENYHLHYNGSGPAASALCMDKKATADVVRALNDPEIVAIPQKVITPVTMFEWNKQNFVDFWQALSQQFQTTQIIIKPRADGCSAGVIRLTSADDLQRYITLLKEQAAYIPDNTFAGQAAMIEMSQDPNMDYLLETYIATDSIMIEKNTLQYTPHTGWLEMTIGVLENAGEILVLNPSITVAQHGILSLEEKFQGGTGINLTPPPESIVATKKLTQLKACVAKVAKALGIQNYARLDLFYNVNTQKVMIIEANSLPALTPSTVLYHQALAEIPPIYPVALLERIIISASHPDLTQTSQAGDVVYENGVF